MNRINNAEKIDKMRKVIILLLAVMCAGVVFGQQQKVAVYVTGAEEGINDFVGAYLVNAIVNSTNYQAVERTADFLKELNKEQGYQRTGAVDDQQLSKLGKQFGVQLVCVAKVGKMGGKYFVSARLIDVETGTVKISTPPVSFTTKDVEKSCETIATSLTTNNPKDPKGHKVAIYVTGATEEGVNDFIGAYLVDDIVNGTDYQAVERTGDFLKELSKEQGYQRTGAVDDQQLSKLGKQFGVQLICVAKVSKMDGKQFVSARLIDVETATVKNSTKPVIFTTEDVKKSCAFLVVQLIPRNPTDPEAQYKLGVIYYNVKEYTEAVKWFRKSAEQGSVRGQYGLGIMYYDGYGVEKNYDEAVKWFRKSEKQGNTSAQNALGVMYESGYGVKKNYNEAVKWYRKSAEQGNADAQNNLGRMYEFGEGVKKDKVQAIEWYKKAAKQGQETAISNLKILGITSY